MFFSPLLSAVPRVQHGFGSESARLLQAFEPHWARRAIQRERHGTTIGLVHEAGQQCGEADGMLTDRPGVPLAIMTADCLPLLLARSDGRQVAALHVGWRGALADMVGQFSRLLQARGDHPAAWTVALGPAAAACCYQVGADVLRQFAARYPAPAPAALLMPRPGYLDLPALVRWQLARDGYGQVDQVAACTICSGADSAAGPTFHSYRRDHATRVPQRDSQWSAIMLTGPG